MRQAPGYLGQPSAGERVLEREPLQPFASPIISRTRVFRSLDLGVWNTRSCNTLGRARRGGG
jgi:hypothetical protein